MLSTLQSKRSKNSVGQKKGSKRSTTKPITMKSAHNVRTHPEIRKALSLLAGIPCVTENKEDTGPRKLVLAKELGILSVMRSMLSTTSVYALRIAYGGGAGGNTFLAAGATGTVSIQSNFTTLMVLSSDWAGLAALFDEFLLEEIMYQLSPVSVGFNVTSPAPVAMAFDDDGNASLTNGYDAVMAYASAKLWCPAVQGNTIATEANSTGFHPITMHYRRPYHVSNNAPVINAQGTGWIDMATPANLLGSFLIYSSGVNASNNVPVYQYVVSFLIKFRCRR